MAKTLRDFRAEKGLYLKDLATLLEMTEDELRAVEDSGIVPEEIGQKLILQYALPADYFAEPVKIQTVKKIPSNPLKYFFGVSIVWSIITSLISILPSFIIQTILTIFSVLSNGNFMGDKYPTFLVSGPISVVVNYFPTVVTLLSGVFLVKYLLKKTNYVGDIEKYRFVYPILPNATVMCISMFVSFIPQTILEKALDNPSYELSQEYMLEVVGSNSLLFIVSLATSLLASFVCAKLLYSAVFDDKEKREKLLRTIAIFVTISCVLTGIIYVARTLSSESFHIVQMITDLIGYALEITLAWALVLVKSKSKKAEMIVYIILPVVTIIL